MISVWVYDKNEKGLTRYGSLTVDHEYEPLTKEWLIRLEEWRVSGKLPRIPGGAVIYDSNVGAHAVPCYYKED
jgi:hypothetical protein